MPHYQAQFVNLDGLGEEEVGSPYSLAATNRDAADDEALAMSAPHGSNFVKVIEDGRVVASLGFAL